MSLRVEEPSQIRHLEPSREFSALPPEMHLRIMSYLNYREVQFLRETNFYFYNLLSSKDLARFRDDYHEVLYQEELDGVENQLSADECHALMAGPNGINREGKKRCQAYLTCFCCFRMRHMTHFSATQRTQRRRKGHIHAKKRFCDECGIQTGKWEPGTQLRFPPSTFQFVYCVKCRRIQVAPEVHFYVQRLHQGFCHRCLLELEDDYTDEQIYEIKTKLAEHETWWGVDAEMRALSSPEQSSSKKRKI